MMGKPFYLNAGPNMGNNLVEMNLLWSENFSLSPAQDQAIFILFLLSYDWLVTLTSAHHQSLPPPGAPRFFFSSLISLSRAIAMMDIAIGILFISLGPGNGLGPPPHSGTDTEDNMKNVLRAKSSGRGLK